MLHTQRIKNMCFCKITQALSTDCFNDMLQGNIVEAAVLEVCSRLKISFATGNVFYEPFRIRSAIFSR